MPKLYVVATPIGNLNDLTPRMKSALDVGKDHPSADYEKVQNAGNIGAYLRPQLKDAVTQRFRARNSSAAVVCERSTSSM